MIQVKRVPSWALAVLLFAALAVRLFQLGTPDLVGGDEGYYGTYARNILEGGFPQLLNLGREPLSSPDNKPFLFPLLLALPVALFGPTEAALRSVPALAGLICAALVWGIVRRRYGELEARAAGLAVLVLPPLVYASRVVMGEGVLAALGLAGIASCIKALEERSNRWAVLAGAFWGAAFLVKLWLVGLFILPVGIALLCDPRRRVEPGSWGRMILAGLAFVVVGGLHLVLVAVLSPSTLRFWFEQYFIFSLLGRAGGESFAGYWHQPWIYYTKVTIQACFPLLPLAFLALAKGNRVPAEKEDRLPQLPMWGVMAAELFLISFMAIKLRQYSFPLVPAIGALAGIGAGSLFSDLSSLRGRRLAAGATLVLMCAVLFWQSGPAPLYPSAAMGAAVILFLAGSEIALAVGARFAQMAGVLLIGAAFAGALGGSAITVKKECLGHRTGYREAARVMAPALEETPPTQAAFLAPEVPAFQFYLFRTGRYWASPYEPHSAAELVKVAEGDAFRAFVTTDRDDLYGGKTPPEVVAWLEANTEERTADVKKAAGGPVPIRVFVKRTRGSG